MNGLGVYKWLFLWSKIEEYVLVGASKDYNEGKLNDEEWRQLLELARIEFETPGMFHRYVPERDDEGDDMLQQLVLYKKADSSIPKNVLEQACSQYDKYCGKALASEGEVHVITDLGATNVDLLHEQIEAYKEFPMVICLGKTDTALENVPPYKLFDGAAVAFLQDEFAVWLKLQAKLERELKNCGGKFADLWSELIKDDSEIAPDIESRLSENGAIIILSSGGGVFVSDKGGIEEEHEWGYSYAVRPKDGGTQKEDKTPVPADGPKKPVFGSTSVKADTAIAAKADSPAVAVTKPGVQLSKVRADKFKMARISANDRGLFGDKHASRINVNGTVVFQDQNEHFYQVPVYQETGNGVKRKLEKKEIQASYLNVCGWVPENWGEHPYVPTGFLIAAPKDTPKTDTAEAALEINEKKEPPPSPNLDKDAVKELVSVIWPKLSGAHHQIMGNIHKISELEGNVKSVAELLGKKSMEECSLPYAAFYQIAVESPHIAARWTGDFRNAYAGALTRITLLENRVQELEKDLEEATKPKKIAFGSTKK